MTPPKEFHPTSLMCISPYLISRLLTLLSLCFVPNSMHFVLSSPKWMLSLLSTNQSQTFEKFLFRFLSISFTSLSIRLSNMSAAYMSTSETGAVDYYHKALHLRYCSSSRSASEIQRDGVKLEFQTNYNSRQCVWNKIKMPCKKVYCVRILVVKDIASHL